MMAGGEPQSRLILGGGWGVDAVAAVELPLFSMKL